MEPIQEDKKPEPVVTQTPATEVEQTTPEPEIIQEEGKPGTYQSVGVGKASKYQSAGVGQPSKYQSVGVGKASKYQSVGVGQASKYQSVGVGKPQKYESLAYKLEDAMGRIPRPNLQAMAKQYAHKPIAFVNAVVDYYRKGIVTYKAKTSDLLTDERIIQVYFKAHFGLYVKVNRTGVEFTHDPGSSVRPDVQVLVDAIRQAKSKANNIVAKARAGNRHSGKKMINDQAITKHLVTGTHKPKPKQTTKAVAQQKQAPKKNKRYNWQKTPNEVKSKTYDRHHEHYKEPFKSYGMSFSGNGEWPVIHGMDGEVDLMIDLNEIMPAMAATFEGQLNKEKGAALFKLMLGLGKYAKHIQVVYGKVKEVDSSSAKLGELATALAGITQSISYTTITVKKKIHELEPKDRADFIKDYNRTLSEIGFPAMTHELYGERPTGYDKEGHTIQKSVYKVSKKHSGYYVELRQNEADSYGKDDNATTTYFKVGANGQMIDAGMLNQQPKK